MKSDSDMSHFITDTELDAIGFLEDNSSLYDQYLNATTSPLVQFEPKATLDHQNIKKAGAVVFRHLLQTKEVSGNFLDWRNNAEILTNFAHYAVQDAKAITEMSIDNGRPTPYFAFELAAINIFIECIINNDDVCFVTEP